jgi:hypothetical protein
MEKPIINTMAPRMHYPLAVGSGSLVRKPPQDDIARPTSFAAPDNVLYLLTGMLYGYTGGSSPQVRLRERSADPIGTWLVSTDGMLAQVAHTPPGTYARALDEIKANLGVTITYVAHCLAMQRSAIYRWYDGRNPHPANRARLETLREFANRWRAARLPSLRNYWESVIPGTAATLGKLLSSQTLDITSLNAAMDRLINRPATMPPKAPRLGFPGRSRNRQKELERLSVLSPMTSREDDPEKESG